MKIEKQDDADAAIPSPFDELAVPAELPEQEAENVRLHLDWVRGNARQFDLDMREAEAECPGDPRLVARAMGSAQQLLNSLQGLEAAHSSVLPAGFVATWRDATEVRLRASGAKKGMRMPDEPEPFKLRVFSSKRFAFETMSVRELQDHLAAMLKHAENIVVNYWWTSFLQTGTPGGRLAGELTQYLYDDVHVRLEIESLDQRLDQCSSPTHPLRSRPDFRTAVASLGFDLTKTAGSSCDGETWEHSTDIERAWAVNNLVLDIIENASERVGSIMSRDVTRAVEGVSKAWERLRATCAARGDSQHQPKTPTGALALRAQDRAVDAALEEARQREEEFEASVRAYVDAELPASDDPDEVTAMRATLELIARARMAGQDPRFFAKRGRFSLEEFRQERDALCQAIALEDARCDWFRHEAKRFSSEYTPVAAPTIADPDVQDHAAAFRQAHPRDSLYRLARHGEKVKAVLAGLQTAGPAHGPVPFGFGGGSRTIAERSSSSSQSAQLTSQVSSDSGANKRADDGAAALSGDVAKSIDGPVASTEAAAGRRKRLASENLRYNLAVANDALRPKRPSAERPRATVAQLAKQIGWLRPI